MNNQLDRIQDLRNSVNELRSILAEGPGGDRYLTLFDEFVRECEIGLALHNICDYLLDPGRPAGSPGTIERIRKLHEVMEIHDDCLERLNARAVAPPS